MGTETPTLRGRAYFLLDVRVKLNNPLMGTETDFLKFLHRIN